MNNHIKWEYKTVYSNTSNLDFSEYGRDGFECFSVIESEVYTASRGNIKEYIFYFKRPIFD